MSSSQRILVVVTNVDQFEKVGFRTGLWLGELVHFLDVLEEAGYQLEIASPAGGKVPIDPESVMKSELGAAVGWKDAVGKRYEDRKFMDLLEETAEISSRDPAQYDAIYLTGGHGVMFDFPTSRGLADLIARFHGAGKVVSAVCHGPSGLLEAKLGSGEYLIRDREVTGFSWKEEGLANREQAVPFNLEEELQRRGAKYEKNALPFVAHVVEDGLLITGQNPASAKEVGEAVLRRLKENA